MIIIFVAFILSLAVILFGGDMGATPGQILFAWLGAILTGGTFAVGSIKEIAALFSKQADGIPADYYHPERGTGVQIIGLNKQPLPNASNHEMGLRHSNGWTKDKYTDLWVQDRADKNGHHQRGYFKGENFVIIDD